MSGIAVVNAGSSSLKFAVFDAAATPDLRFRGLIEGIGATPRARLSDAAGAILSTEDLPVEGFDHAAAARMMTRLAGRWLGGKNISVVGHRVVHGGGEFAAPICLTDEIVERLAAYIPLAPLHQPHNLAVIQAMRELHPQLPQIACFDTAFHRSQAPLA